ncbi:cell wall surface anchor family protein [Minicystis rosea]|nr:cell wall surface anchor family protein [Minicystis rosea]
MRALLPWIHRGALLASLALPLATTGCVGTQSSDPATPHGEGQITAVAVPDEAFAASLQRLLRDGRATPERTGLLVGVVRRQLAHAAQRFEKGNASRATDGVIGALYLVRTGEGRGEMVDADGEKALGGAVLRLSSRGDEGRAEALMRMRAAALPAGTPARADVEEHLAALAQWQQDTHNGGTMRRLGAIERAAVSRALVEPSDKATEAAVRAVSEWIARAIEANIAFQQTGKRFSREEAVEIQRAIYSGAATMATLFLRNGDAKGALEALDQTGARRVMKPALYTRIHDVAQNDGARDWIMLAAAFAAREPDDEEPDTDIDPQLVSAGLWGTALEAYRREPANFEAAQLLARALVRFGMPEAAPLVLADALAKSATPASTSAAMDILLAAMAESASIDDHEAARRTFKAAEGLFQHADRAELKNKIEPSAARARFVMAGIEVRTGNLAAARPLLTRATADEPTVSAYTTLAMVDRQAGDAKAALEDVDRALRAPDARTSLLDVADAHLLTYELLRDGGSTPQAKAALDASLNAALQARQIRGNAGQRARAERILGRVLSTYGDARGATRAFERALTLAATDRPSLGAAMLDTIGRALVRRDLPSARAALKRGIEGDVSDEDLAYGGLWVSLLERELKATSDGTVDRAFRAGQRSAWTAKLTAWAAGKMTDAQLSTAAQSASQRVEAAFYTAMARRLAGDPTADQKLRAVATAPVIDLLEVQLARELTAPRVGAELPGGVQLP